ncbi:MAG: ATP-binding protein [Propionicimonas sp.]
MGSRSYRIGVESGLSWAYAALTFGFATTWVVTAVPARGQIGPGLWAALAAYVVLTGFGGWRAARLRLGHWDVTAMAVVAVALQMAWTRELEVVIAPGQRCMVTTAVVVGAVTFAASGRRVVLVVTAVSAQLLADWVGVGLLTALGGMWPVAAAGIAIVVCVPVLREAAGRADAAADELQRVSVKAAGQGAQQQARRDIQGVLHDDVVPALRAVSLPEVTQSEARQAAKGAVAAIERSPAASDDRAPCDLTRFVRDLDPVPGTVTTIQSAEDLSVAGDIARAVTAAAAEVLRNIARHAHASHVRVVLEEDGDGFVLTIEDDGVGFRPAAAMSRSHGLRYSVVRRMEDVGGRADVTSAPGRGTTVRLAWQSVFTDLRRELTRPERVAAGIDDVRRPLAAVCLPYLAMSGGFAIWYTIDGQLPGWLLVWFAGLCMLTLTLLARAHTELSGAMVSAALGYGVAGTIISLSVLPPGALHHYSSWSLGAIAPLLALVAVVRPIWEAGAALFVTQMTIAVAALAGLSGQGQWTDQLAAVAPTGLSTVTPVVLGLVIGQAVLRLGDVVTLANNDRSMRAAAESARGARDSVHQRRLVDLNEEILPFLRGVADAVVTSGRADVREHARMLEHAARDELHIPGVLDPTARELLRRARAGGCVVTIQTGGADIQSPALVRDVLVAALASGAPPRELVLSLAQGEQGEQGAKVNLVTVPGSTDRAAALQRRFADVISMLDSTPEATWAELSVPAVLGERLAGRLGLEHSTNAAAPLR